MPPYQQYTSSHPNASSPVESQATAQGSPGLPRMNGIRNDERRHRLFAMPIRAEELDSLQNSGPSTSVAYECSAYAGPSAAATLSVHGSTDQHASLMATPASDFSLPPPQAPLNFTELYQSSFMVSLSESELEEYYRAFGPPPPFEILPSPPSRAMTALKEMDVVRPLVLRAHRQTARVTALGSRRGYHQAESALGHVRGEEAKMPCEKCQKLRGPYAQCIILPGNVGFGACSNCHHESQSIHCTIRTIPKQRNYRKKTLDTKPHSPTGLDPKLEEMELE
ncbi:MAG: hypothetical protein M1834_003637 [Cirrosporium novae-zelandiae]|nr:MAG: hypothetical protein M1834_003637 [Cirrosporium novae-zelandiae]